MVVYHCTKVFDKDSIIKKGLMVNDWARYSTSLLNTCLLLGMSDSDIEKIMSYIKYEYDRVCLILN